MKIRIVATMLAIVLPVWSATSTTWEVSGFTDFLKGRLSNLSLTVNGSLQAGPSIEHTIGVNQPTVWALAAAPGGGVYAATGHQGKVIEANPDGRLSEVWSSPEPEVFAVCVDNKGRLYAGTSPNGALYRIENGKASELWRSPSKYIWSLTAVPDGSVYIGTGDAGKIYRSGGDGKTALYYDTGQMNVTSLAMGPNGHLLAGTDPNGLLYDVAGAGKATVLYDSNLPEIRSLAVAADGTVYAAAMGGAVSSRSGTTPASISPAPTAVTTATPTVITVTEAAGGNVDQQSAAPPAQQGQTSTSSAASSAAAASSSGVVEVAGMEKSAIYKITPDRAVQTIRTSKDDNVYDLFLDGEALVFATDAHGRIFRLEGQQTTLLAELADGEITRMLQRGGRLFAGMSNPGRVFVVGAAGSKPGRYESTVHDAISVARWGQFRWHSYGSGVVFRTRSGYSARPDGTWSEWSGPITDVGRALIESPPARFVQWAAEWPAGADARLDTVDVPYLPQNNAPTVHSITVTSVLGTNTAKTTSAAAATSSAYSITVTDTGEAPAASSGTSSAQNVSRLQTTQTQISWQADDPDSDKLAYSVYFRAEDESEWQLVRSRMFETTLLLDPDVFADGRYYFRVVASDAPSNAQEFAHEAELVSTPVLIDNTPPVVTIGTPRRSGDSLDIDVVGEDRTSPLRVCEYSLDAGSWQPIEADDGVTDSPREQFHLHLDKVRPGEHLLVFRIYDVANNAGLARVVLR